ncbi:dynein light chain roadblock-type 1 isoform X2 [Myotis daubentonii]|uniref:dynein light chain roadblock-type 1 isoform X2 n=1 Tax=Myotis daubentonii TaxID=98922 RepID=UPI002872D943|nr:dynein light chain roadblock-type 1 isoform X2 [Myotis daubentonii]
MTGTNRCRSGGDTEATSEPEGSAGNHRGEHRSPFASILQWRKLSLEVQLICLPLQSQDFIASLSECSCTLPLTSCEGPESGCIPIKSTMDNPTTTQYANLMHNFILKARSTVREIDPQNDLTFLRIRSKKNEIMVAPDKDYFLIVIQNPTE